MSAKDSQNIESSNGFYTLLGTVTQFIEWKNKQTKIKRGNRIMYDIKRYHKYVYENEMYGYWLEHCNCA